MKFQISNFKFGIGKALKCRGDKPASLAADSPFAIRNSQFVRAFTLIELLLVLAIIGLLAALGMPALRGFGKSNSVAAAQRQMLDDIAAARQRAIAEHTEVYLVFASPALNNLNWAKLSGRDSQLATNILREQYSSYALFSYRSIGDQPGNPTRRYLTPWRTLPQGIFIAAPKFPAPNSKPLPGSLANDFISQFETNSFPFPTATNDNLSLPCLGFNYQGQLFSVDDPTVRGRDNGSEIIPLAQGFIAFEDRNSPLRVTQVQEKPVGNSRTTTTTWNHVRIDGLTGRARIERTEIKR